MFVSMIRGHPLMMSEIRMRVKAHENWNLIMFGQGRGREVKTPKIWISFMDVPYFYYIISKVFARARN